MSLNLLLDRKINALEDLLFDVLTNVKTVNQIVAHEDLNTSSPFKESGTAHLAAWSSNIRKLISEFILSEKNYREFTFMDVGCGVGKACFLASFYGFKNIEGFDFDPSLVQIAKSNLKKFRFNKAKISIVEGDAGTYKLETNKKYLIFMFNPFDEKVLTLFLENNKSALQNCNIAYSNDRQAKALIKFGFEPIFRQQNRKISLWKINS